MDLARLCDRSGRDFPTAKRLAYQIATGEVSMDEAAAIVYRLIDGGGPLRDKRRIKSLVEQLEREKERRQRAEAGERAARDERDAGRVKRCPRCDETKPLVDFGIYRSSTSGRQSYCTVCNAEQAKERTSVAPLDVEHVGD